MFNVVANKAWENLDVDGFDDLVECQVLTDYTIQEEILKSKGSDDLTSKKKKVKRIGKEEEEVDEHSSDEEIIKQKTKIVKSKKVKTPDLSTKNILTTSISKTNALQTLSPKPSVPSAEESMVKWEGLGVPNSVLRCLREMGFTCPTPIQQAALPAAINNRSDIIAAAATGSGKTLAFGIPIVTHILEIDDDEEEEEDGVNDGDGDSGEDDDSMGSGVDMKEVNEEDDEQEMEEDDGEENDKSYPQKTTLTSHSHKPTTTVTPPITTATPPTTTATPPTTTATPPATTTNHMYSLILTPTRELAMQVTQHISSICKYNHIRVTAVVGGISVEKQQRLLKRRPQIVVATPGRLWQFIQMREPHLSDTFHLRHVVVDEVDRVVERGHFEEVQHILAYIQAHSNLVLRRQVYILSATLSFVHKKPHRVMAMKKKKMKEMTLEDKLDSLKKTLHMSSKPKVIDLTQGQSMTSPRLQEVKVSCEVADKDAMLFHLMATRPERTLVFANSKDCIRRLCSLFAILHHHPCLHHAPLPLHSDMSMRQRLKNLDEFKARDTGLLLATDVAARGLDITAVGRVVHYQVPRTTENYVHRSGRTARSDKGGVSVLMVSPQEDVLYRRIMMALKRVSGLDDLPIERSTLQLHITIVSMARKLEVLEYRQKKERVNADWWKQACKEADMVCDDEDDDDVGRHADNGDEKDVERKALLWKRKELMTMMGVVDRKKKKTQRKQKTCADIE